MEKQNVFTARPVEKTPKRKFYLYVKRFCSECGLIHIYRKMDEERNPVRYACLKNYQMWLVGEEAAVKQESLFN